MPKFFFDCLIDNSLYPDDFGINMLSEEISDQAQAVLINLIQEISPVNTSKSITVTVRDEQGSSVYIAQAMLSQHHIIGGMG